MTRLTGNIYRTIPNPEYVDDETTPEVEPSILEPVDALFWLVEVDTDTPRVFCVAVDSGVVRDNDIPAGQYRYNGEYTQSDKPAVPDIVTVDGLMGVYRDTYPNATYDEETGELVDQGAAVSVFFPIRDSGGFGPCVHIPEDEPETLEWGEASGPYVPPVVEEEPSE